MKKIAIIGGGITGMVSALRLAENGYKVELFERESYLGGLLGSFNYKGCMIPMSPHQFFEQDVNFLNILNEFNLKPNWALSKTGIWSGQNHNNLYSLTTPLDIIKFNLLTFRDRFKLALFAIKLRIDKVKGTTYDNLKNINAKDWLIGQTGPKVYSVFFKPLLLNKFAVNLSEISAEWLAVRLRDLTSTAGKWGYVDGGLQSLIDDICSKLIKLDCTIHRSSEVTEIKENKGERFSLTYRNVNNGVVNETCIDSLLSTIAAPLLPRIIPWLPKNYKNELNQIEYSPYIGGVMFLKKPVTKFHITYFLNSTIGGINEFTNFYNKLPYKVIYLFKYLNEAKNLWDKTEEAIKIEFTDVLKTPFPHIKIDDLFIFKERYASPIFRKDFTKYVPGIITPVKNVYVAGMFNYFPRIRNMDSGVFIAEKAALQILENDRQ